MVVCFQNGAGFGPVRLLRAARAGKTPGLTAAVLREGVALLTPTGNADRDAAASGAVRISPEGARERELTGAPCETDLRAS